MKGFLAGAAVALVMGAGVARAVEIGAEVQSLGTDQRYDNVGDKKTGPKISELRIPVSVLFGLKGPLGLKVTLPYVSRSADSYLTLPAANAAGLGDVEVGVHLTPKIVRIGVDAILPTGTSPNRKALGATELWLGGPMLGGGAGPASAGGWFGFRPSIRVEPPIPAFDLWAEGSYLLTMAISSDTAAGGMWKADYGDPIRIAAGGGMAFGPLTVGLGLEYVTTAIGREKVEGGTAPMVERDIAGSEGKAIRLIPEAKVKAGPFGARVGAAISLAGKDDFAGATLFGGLLLKF